MTPKEAAGLISFAQLAGMDPTEGMAQNLKGAATVYATVLDQWGITIAEAEAAVLAIAGEPWTSEYRRKVPTPGEIVGRTAVGRAALAAGSDAELDQAWRRFDVVMRGMLTERPDGTRGPRGPGDLHPDPLKAAAMWAGLDAIGGVEGYRNRPVDDVWAVKRWKEAVRAERLRQAQEPRTRRMLASTNGERRMLTGGK